VLPVLAVATISGGVASTMNEPAAVLVFPARSAPKSAIAAVPSYPGMTV